jgi:nucleotide-binding universal stress UspA family protein
MFHRILVAIDRSPSTPVTISYATALAHQDRASVAVLLVNRFLAGKQLTTELPHAEAADLVDEAVLLLDERGIEATGSVVHAASFALGQTIARHALEYRSDVIVVGSRRRTALPRLFGQGARERITRHSPLPVLVAPAPLRVTGGRHGWSGSGRVGPNALRGTA